MATVVIQARLNPDVDHERLALDVYTEREERGHKARRIMADALLALGDYPIYEQDSVKAVRAMLEDLQSGLIDTIAALLEDKISELAVMSPGERRQQIERAARSSFGASIIQALDVADYEEEE